MPTMRFTDGMSIDTDGPYRVIHRRDGLYVVGHGFMCAVDTRTEGEAIIREMEAPRAPDTTQN